MGLVISIIFKIVMYLVIIGGIHYSIMSIQAAFTQPKKRIVATNQRFYAEIEEKIQRSNGLGYVPSTPPSTETDAQIDMTTTSIDSIPSNGGGRDGGIDGGIDGGDIDMKEQLKNFLKSSGTSSTPASHSHPNPPNDTHNPY
jgi:ABC-type Na+ efflux pump permease subunit